MGGGHSLEGSKERLVGGAIHPPPSRAPGGGTNTLGHELPSMHPVPALPDGSESFGRQSRLSLVGRRSFLPIIFQAFVVGWIPLRYPDNAGQCGFEASAGWDEIHCVDFLLERSPRKGASSHRPNDSPQMERLAVSNRSTKHIGLEQQERGFPCQCIRRGRRAVQGSTHGHKAYIKDSEPRQTV